jgi:hypothetical protein
MPDYAGRTISRSKRPFSLVLSEPANFVSAGSNVARACIIALRRFSVTAPRAVGVTL